VAITPSAPAPIGEAIVAFSGWPPTHLGWAQYRSLGAAALDLCAVACGDLDGFVDCGTMSLAPWDYLGGLLVCTEAGAVVAEAFGRDLVVRSFGPRRTVVAASAAPLLAELSAGRRSFGAEPPGRD
jgi:fructose-1,6-bisphosphatase/inositol monophosphatase family enzyme